MREVKRGDRIFHYVKGFIVAISVVKEDCKEGSKPQTMQNHNRWNDAGYLVSTEYRELEVPLNIREHFSLISRFLPIKYSAFQEDGSGNQGYLYPCNEELSITLLELIGVLNVYNSNEDQLELPVDEVIEKERNPLQIIIAETESEAKMKIRRGQQKFRKDLMPLWNNQCPLCGISLEILLRASHSKPWKDSSDAERLDPYNGILLCCNHDALYDKGLISFDGQGRLHISTEISEEEYPMYGLKKNANISVHPENKFYFNWHRKNVFVEKSRV